MYKKIKIPIYTDGEKQSCKMVFDCYGQIGLIRIIGNQNYMCFESLKIGNHYIRHVDMLAYDAPLNFIDYVIKIDVNVGDEFEFDCGFHKSVKEVVLFLDEKERVI